MKISLYVEDGVTQIMLTPQTEFEKSLVKQISTKPHDIGIHSGSFEECRGGWVRHFESGPDSLMLKITETRHEHHPDALA